MKSLNKDILNWYFTLNNADEYAKPYLTLPTQEYMNADTKILLLGKETNGWADELDKNTITQEDLENLYTEIISNGRETMKTIPFWRFYFELKDTVDAAVPSKVGWHIANTALLGKCYDETGFDTTLKTKLSFFLKRLITILQPDIILIFAGYGTELGMHAPYTELLEPIYGKYLGNLDDVSDYREVNGYPLRRLYFSNTGLSNLYGSRHPERAGEVWREDVINKVIKIVRGG